MIILAFLLILVVLLALFVFIILLSERATNALISLIEKGHALRKRWKQR
jgi:hypothetical protein